MSPIWVAIPIGPATGGGAVGSLATEPTRLPSPPTIRPIAPDRLLRADARPPSGGRSAAYVAVEVRLERLLDAGDPERALVRVDVGLRAQRHRRPRARCLSSSSIVRTTVSPARLRSPSRATRSPVGTGSARRRCATIASPGRARPPPPANPAGPRGTGSPMNGEREPGDAGKDDEGQEDVHDHAGDQDRRACVGSPCAAKDRGSWRSFPSSPSSLTNPPIGSQLSV